MADKKTIYESQESLYKKALKKMKDEAMIVQYAYKTDNYKKAAAMFDEVGDYLDAPQLAAKCRELAEQAVVDGKEHVYTLAVERMCAPEVADEVWPKIRDAFAGLGDYRDSEMRLQMVQEKIDKLNKKANRKRNVVLGLLGAGVILVGAGAATGFFRYTMGYGFLKAGLYDQAGDIFESMPGFLNADAYAEEAKYTQLVTAEVGKNVHFGKYEWKLLAADGDIRTMIAASVGKDHDFYAVPFNTTAGETSWADSSLRAWLNGEIYENGFSEAEKKHLVLQTSAESTNEAYGTSYEETQDYLTVPSVETRAEYESAFKSLALNFWLRMPGATYDTVVYQAEGKHTVISYGAPATEESMAVRPIIVVDTNGLTGDMKVESAAKAEEKKEKEEKQKSTPKELQTLASTPIGKDVTWGKYKWKLLSEEDGVRTMIAASIQSDSDFYRHAFDESGSEEVTWENSTLRAWLNGEILENGFTEEERSHMVLQTTAASENTEYGTKYEETQDYLTLPTFETAEKYADYFKSLSLDYWMASPGARPDTPAFISAGTHKPMAAGYLAGSGELSVRPIIQVDVSELTS